MAKKESGFIRWYESYQGKKVTGIIYSAGASVVIIGALFKIMHFPGAGPVLMTGMITESLLFMIGVLDKPHQDFHWENVFPQVCGYGTEPEYLAELQSRPRPTLLGAGVEEGVAPTQTEDKKKANVPALTEKDMEALKEGIDGLAKTAVQLQDLGKVAVASNKLGEKMEAAGEKLGAAVDNAGQKMVAASDKMAVIGDAAAKFVASADVVSKKNEELGAAYGTIVADMQGVVAETKNLHKGVENIGTKLGSLNSVYELQLNALQAQVEAYKAQTAQVTAASDQVKAMSADVQKMQASINEAVKEHAAYEAAAKKLAQQVADLNKVYGNMLNALA
ncbi:MAG: gliding motility protein GldL [Paludibacteraceae bacterium]|nr:gliding motility protein GldL [Paludibacteraceae bacterium]